jgi:predicted GIY-YIG superfamily endonuclease
MHYVYIIRNEAKRSSYIGFTNNLEQRLRQHKLTKDIELIDYEAYKHEEEARQRERRLKMYGSAWRGLKQRLNISYIRGHKTAA